MIDFIDSLFETVSPYVGLSKDQTKLVAILYFAVPLCAVLKRLPDDKPHLKNLFNIAYLSPHNLDFVLTGSVSLFFLVGVYDLWTGLWLIVTGAIGTYVLAFGLKGPLMPWIVFVFVMGQMSVSQLIRQFHKVPDSIIDYTGVQMVLVQKLTAFAWNVYDGRQNIDTLQQWQKDRAVMSPPSLLDFFGYVFFFPGLMTGPAFDFAEYKRWVTLTMFDVKVPDPKSTTGGTKRRRKIPHSGIPATMKLIEGTLWLALFETFSRWFYPEFMLSDDFLQYSFLRRLLYLQPVGMTHRFKYFGVWKMAEGACILSGLGFHGYNPDGTLKWDRMTNVSPIALETAQNNKAYLEAWNQMTNKWLKNYVYLRVTPRGKKPGFRSAMATFTTSAVWHGFYPGYYLTFVSAAFIQTCGKYYRRHFRPFFLDPDLETPTKYKKYYDIVCYVVIQTTYNYIAMPFLLLTIADSFKLWGRLYFYVHIGIAVSLAFFHSPGKDWLDSKLRRKARRRDSVSKYNAAAKRDLSRSTGKGVFLVPPMPESVKEMKS